MTKHRRARRVSRGTDASRSIEGAGGEPRDWILNGLELRLRRSKGEMLQRFLAVVMRRIHGDAFVGVGTERAWGDLKCDGLLDPPLTVFACYGAVDGGVNAVRGTVRKVAAKVRDDFAGALRHWDGLRRWVFVTNYIEMPALVAGTILSLRREHPAVRIEIWDLDRFHRLLGELPAREVEWILRQDVSRPPSDASPGHAITSPSAGRFVGRQADLDRLAEWTVAAPRGEALLVLGAPGIGKTALTRRLAARPEVVARFGNRRRFVPLEGARTRKTFETAVATSLGGGSFRDAIGLFGDRDALLVLDNLETPWEASPAGIEAVLDDLLGAGFTLVASMRGLDRPRGAAWEAIHLEPLRADSSRHLFLSIADRIGPRDRSLADLLKELGGIPLAIELVAHQAAAFAHVEPILREWRRVGTAMARDPAAAGGRLSSLDVSIELSMTSPRLTREGRRLLRTLSFLPAGAAIADVPYLLGEAPYAAMRSCLATALAFEDRNRLDLLPPIRRYVTRRPDDAAAGDWIGYYAAFVGKDRDHASGPSPERRAGGDDVANVVQAVAAALADRPEVLATVSAGRLAELLVSTGEHAPGLLEGMVEAYDRSHAAGPALLAAIACGRVSMARSEFAAAREAFEGAMARAEALGSRQEMAEALVGMAETLRASDTPGARRRHAAAYAAFRSLGCRHGKARALAGLGTCSLEVGKRISAARAFRRARETFGSLGDVAAQALNEWRSAQIGLLDRDHAAAREGFRSALSRFAAINDARGRANCLRGLGRSAILSADDLACGQRHTDARAELGAAYGFIREAQRTFRRASSALGVSECIRSRAEIMLGLGRLGAAAAAYGKALAIDAAVGSLRGQGFCHIGLTDVAIGRSDATLAGEHLTRASALFNAGRISDGLDEVEERRMRLVAMKGGIAPVRRR